MIVNVDKHELMRAVGPEHHAEVLGPSLARAYYRAIGSGNPRMRLNTLDEIAVVLEVHISQLMVDDYATVSR